MITIKREENRIVIRREGPIALELTIEKGERWARKTKRWFIND